MAISGNELALKNKALALTGHGPDAPKSLDELIASFGQKEQEAKLSNLKREEQVRAIYDEIIQRYQPGGTFQARGEALIGRRKTQDVGARTQHAISSGLFNTAATGAMGQSWEQDVGAEMRLGLEDTMMQRLSQAQIGKADFIERIENRYPDTNQLAGLAQQAGQSTRYGDRGESLWSKGSASPSEAQAMAEQTNRYKTAMASSFGKTGYKRPGSAEEAMERKSGGTQGDAGLTGFVANRWFSGDIAKANEFMKKPEFNRGRTEMLYKAAGSPGSTSNTSNVKATAADEAAQRARTYGPTRESFGIPERKPRYGTGYTGSY